MLYRRRCIKNSRWAKNEVIWTEMVISKRKPLILKTIGNRNGDCAWSCSRWQTQPEKICKSQRTNQWHSLRTLYWFVLCNLQIFSGCVLSPLASNQAEPLLIWRRRDLGLGASKNRPLHFQSCQPKFGWHCESGVVVHHPSGWGTSLLEGIFPLNERIRARYFYWPPGPNPVVTISTRVGPGSRLCHLEQLHAKFPFLFPIVFSINLIPFFNICSVLTVLSPGLFGYVLLNLGRNSCCLWFWQLVFGISLRDATSNLHSSPNPPLKQKCAPRWEKA